MDAYITDIANLVAQKLNTAKALIATGKTEVKTYVDGLAPELKKLGKEAASSIEDKFDSLEQTVDDKKDALIDILAEKYAENLASVDSKIEALKAANGGLINKALGALQGVFDFIIKIKTMLMSLLSSVSQAVTAIITDPIGFLKNLMSGVGQGFKNFGSNVMKHLKTGFFGWLTGAMKGVSFTMPDNPFSLKGIFSISMQLLGIGWNGIRAIGAKVIGEPIMQVLETGLEVVQVIKKDGVAGLWEYLKDQFQDLKTTVMDAVMSMVQNQIIQAGIKFILSLLTPAGALMKAAMAIIDVVKFFIQRAAQIMELVQAFIDSIAAIASGKVSAVAGAIENALGKAVPVLIGLLASVLGIGGLANKVLGVIRKIRKRIETGIINFWRWIKIKGRKLLRRIGRSKIGKKAKNLYDKGKEKVQNIRDKVSDYFMGTISFTAADGSKHRIYPKSRRDPKRIMLASTPKPIEVQLISEIAISKENGDIQNVNKLEAAKTYYLVNVKGKVSKLAVKERELNNTKRDVTGADKNAINSVEKLVKSRDERFAELKRLLELATYSHGKKTKVKTHVTYQDSGSAGDFVEAKPLTYLKGNTKGAKPGSANPPGWRFAQGLNKQFDGDVYIRGHMLNDNIHGPNSNWNLKPISQRMNREMDQKIENHAVREHKEKHKILYYRATVKEYHKGERNSTGAFPKTLIVEWGHLLKDGKFDENGTKVKVQEEKMSQSFPESKSININEFGETLLVRNLTNLGLSEKFIKGVIVYLKNTTEERRFENDRDFIKRYNKLNDKRKNSEMFDLFLNLLDNRQINFN